MKRVPLLLLVVGVCLSILPADEPASQPASQPATQPALKYPWAGTWGNEPFTEASQQPKTMTATEMMPVYRNWTYKNPVPAGVAMKPQWRFPYDRDIALDPGLNNVEALCARAKFTHPTTGIRIVGIGILMHALEAIPGPEGIMLKVDLFIVWDGAVRAEPEYTGMMKHIIKFWRDTFRSSLTARSPENVCPGADKWPIAVTTTHQSQPLTELGFDGKYKQLGPLPPARR